MDDKNNISKLDEEYLKIISDNPDKKFILYLRHHPNDEKEVILANELKKSYGEYKILQKERLILFIVLGRKVVDFLNNLNNSRTNLYLSYILSEDEMQNNT